MTNDTLTDLGVTDFDAASELNSLGEMAAFLQDCMEEAPEDAAFIAHALGVVARAKARMASIADQSGLSRESLYKALSGRRDPSFSTVLKVVAAMGLRLQFVVDERSVAPSTEATVVHPQTANSAAQHVYVFLSHNHPPKLTGSYFTESVKTELLEFEPASDTRARSSAVAKALSIEAASHIH